ncbi:hypothetical protein [Mycobacterium sp.]|jgi:hypothetical protein|uniref:hypothetical protein n=1 Tax=Mycobacterium sp. TaxID=1785 RepID=UPI002BBF6BF7|nr:hypothetical protein [Mycobacterium sp.]HTH89491.1 hypothetical protein [Mycobacterium sp.]
MNDILPTYGSDLDESRERLVPQQTSTESTALITEQQVLFSTAAAVPLPPTKTRRWSDAVHAVTGALRGVFAATEKSSARKHYPKRHDWLDNALMAREMDRL